MSVLMMTVLLMSGGKPPADWRLDLLDAMVVELDRNAQLTLNDNARPYFISYLVKDYEQRTVAARYGALFQDDATHDRRASVDVRVGDYTFDSSTADEDFNTAPRSYIARKNAPIESSPGALRTTLWLLTDEKYKAAIFNYLKKKGEAVYALDAVQRVPAFSKEERVMHVGKRALLTFSKDRWAVLAREVSARLAREPAFFDSEVRITADKVVRLYVNTEGTRLVTEDTLLAVHVQAWTRAVDGQLLDNVRDWYAPTEALLPKAEVIRASVDALAQDLIALRAAPALDPYSGPAILEAEAAGGLFHEAIGHRLEGERLDRETEGKTFRGQLGRQVLPTFLSIFDDATLISRAGVPLNGHFEFDDEGVLAKRVSLIEEGVLKSYLLSRRPVGGLLKSNGHGRAQGTRRPIARMANFIVESSKRVSADELRRLLLDEAKRQGRPFALVIRDLSGGNTNTSGYGYQAFKGVPRMVYKVDVQTGVETLVRGVEIVGTPLSSVNRVLMASTGEGVFNGFCGAESGMVPVSTVAPAVLVQELELQRTVEGRERGPLLPAP